MFIPGYPMQPQQPQPVFYHKPRTHVYQYSGPVFYGGNVIGTYYGETTAQSMEKAFSNLLYKAKQEAGYLIIDSNFTIDVRYMSLVR